MKKYILLFALIALSLLSCEKKTGGKGTPTPTPPKTEDQREKENNNSYVTFTIASNLPDDYKKLYLYIDAQPEDQKYIWIDKNNNGKKDSGEAITNFGINFEKENEIPFTSSTVLKLYGKVTHLAGRTNFRFTKFESNTNKSLYYLDLGANFMEEINIASLVNLQYLCLRENTIEKLDLSTFTKLKVLDLGYTNYFKTELRNCPDLEYIDFSSRNFAKYGIENFTKLKTLILRDNGLEEFDASTLVSLEGLDLSGNQLGESALQKLYQRLPDRNGKTPGVLLIKGNPGAGIADYQLAKARNWKVDDTAERLTPTFNRENLPIYNW